MTMPNSFKITTYLLIIFFNCLEIVHCQENPYRRERVSWCTVSTHEQKKCNEWSKAIEDVNKQASFGQEPLELNLDCIQAIDKDQCMSMIDDERADLVLLDPGEIEVAGRYHSLSPIMIEKYGPGRLEKGRYSVAIVKKRSQTTIQSLSDLFGKKACFSGVSHMASWTLPLASLIDLPKFSIADCNNLVKSASYFFGNSCAPNALKNKFNPTGDNPQKMSYLCDRRSRVGAHHDPYNGVFATLKCLSDLGAGTGSYGEAVTSLENRGGDVAFVRHNTVQLTERLNLPPELRSEIPSRIDIELLCPQGGRQPVENWQNCHFGFVPPHAVVVSSRVPIEKRMKIQRFLRTSIQLFSGPLTTVAYSYPNQSPTQNINNRLYNQVPVQQTYDTSVVNYNLLKNIEQNYANNSISQFKLTGDWSYVSYPALDVLFSSDMTDLEPLDGYRQTFKGFMNNFTVQQATTSAYMNSNAYQAFVDYSQVQVNTFLDYFEKLRKCPIPAVTLCVNSDKEFLKCQAMSKAFHAAGLRPELGCKLASSSLSCMQMIKDRDADLTVLDAADIYIAGKRFNLIPIVSEQIEMHESSYYAIAVARKNDPTTDLFNLKGKRSCHSGFMKAAGWMMPLGVLLSNDKMRSYQVCDSAHSAAEYFDKACAPGILSHHMPTSNEKAPSSSGHWTIRNMCELCHGSDRSFCSRDASEPFYGDTGALRCLVEGGGEVAFCKHTTIYENTGGSNRQTWARGLIKEDFELLCRDGSRAPIDQYKSCNLGKVSSNAMVARKDSSMDLINAYANLFLYGQQYYGSKYSEEYTFKMFVSNDGDDLIFQDATQQISRIPIENTTYTNYLNYDLLTAIGIVVCA